MVCHSLLQWTTFCQTSPPWSDRLGWPHMVRLNFIEIEKTVVLRSSWLVFCDYGFSVSAFWCPLTTPTILLRFLLPRTWDISSSLLQQSVATAPFLGWGVSSEDHYIYYCGEESLGRNGVTIRVNKRVWNAVLGCSLKNERMISVHFQGKPFKITAIQDYAPISNAKEAEVEW